MKPKRPITLPPPYELSRKLQVTLPYAAYLTLAKLAAERGEAPATTVRLLVEASVEDAYHAELARKYPDGLPESHAEAETAVA